MAVVFGTPPAEVTGTARSSVLLSTWPWVLPDITWVQPVLAVVAGELGVLVTISCRLKLSPWSRLLADGAWAVAGACPWAGVEDTDTMQDCTLLRELGPGQRPLDTSETLPDR